MTNEQFYETIKNMKLDDSSKFNLASIANFIDYFSLSDKMTENYNDQLFEIACALEKSFTIKWHNLKKNPNDLPTTDDDKLYLVYVYSNSPEKFRFGEYTPVVCLWNYDFCRFDILESTIGDSAVNTKNILKWRELESC